MYCPVCGKQQVNDQTRFCSGCGFPLGGVSEVVAAGGASLRLASQPKSAIDSPRKKGVKKGAWVMLVGCFLFVPILAISVAAFHISPFLVSAAAILSFMGGLLRIIYALMFEAGTSEVVFDQSQGPAQIGSANAHGALPPQMSMPVGDFQMPGPGAWRETNDLVPNSVTESTTRLLDKEKNQ